MSRKEHWDEVYTKKRSTEVSWFLPRPETSLELIDEIGLDQSARIIDVGSGASRLVDHLVERGQSDITLLDVSSKALDVTKQRLGSRADGVRFVRADITEAKLSGPFNLWHDRAVFHFLTDEADRAKYIATMSAAIPVDGHAVIATFADDGPTRCSGLPVVRYSADSLQDELGRAFELRRTHREMHQKPAGGEQAFVFCLFRRATASR